LLLVVEDDGPGIAEQAREHVLRRGGRADPGTEGHGIGLAVVREIAAAYGGELLIERSELGGARVSVRFPAL
jgi:two-component system sensor histidine kinase PhoQ